MVEENNVFAECVCLSTIQRGIRPVVRRSTALRRFCASVGSSSTWELVHCINLWWPRHHLSSRYESTRLLRSMLAVRSPLFWLFFGLWCVVGDPWVVYSHIVMQKCQCTAHKQNQRLTWSSLKVAPVAWTFGVPTISAVFIFNQPSTNSPSWTFCHVMLCSSHFRSVSAWFTENHSQTPLTLVEPNLDDRHRSPKITVHWIQALFDFSAKFPFQ